jgi:hypothetical protein
MIISKQDIAAILGFIILGVFGGIIVYGGAVIFDLKSNWLPISSRPSYAALCGFIIGLFILYIYLDEKQKMMEEHSN